jgi:hypothetical protein
MVGEWWVNGGCSAYARTLATRYEHAWRMTGHEPMHGEHGVLTDAHTHACESHGVRGTVAVCAHTTIWWWVVEVRCGWCGVTCACVSYPSPVVASMRRK